MKKIILLIVVMFVVAISITKAQDGINYQAVVRDNTGELMKNAAVAVEFNIVETSTVGTKVYTETHALTTNNFGNIVAIIGQGTPTLGTFATIDWASDKHFLNVVIDGNDMGTTEFLSVPYALHAKTADALKDPDWKRNGSVLYNETDNFVMGSSSPSAGKLTVTKSYIGGGELADFYVDSIYSNSDILNLNYNKLIGTSPAQFIEMNKDNTNIFQLNTDGTLKTSSRTGSANMLPIAYGNIAFDGTIRSSTSNVSNVITPSVGSYTIDIADESINMDDYIVIVNSINSSSTNVSWGHSNSKLRIYVKDIGSDTYTTSAFNFIIYKP